VRRGNVAGAARRHHHQAEEIARTGHGCPRASSSDEAGRRFERGQFALFAAKKAAFFGTTISGVDESCFRRCSRTRSPRGRPTRATRGGGLAVAGGHDGAFTALG
jgi:hypothetical protein